MSNNTFLSNLTKNDVRGENGMPAHSTSDSAVLDLFFLLGTRPSADRVRDAVSRAWAEDKTLTLKALFQSRDIRGGKGERDSFREAIKYLGSDFPAHLVPVIPEYGRWDDLHSLLGTPVSGAVVEAIEAGLAAKNGLCAKWQPRKGKIAAELAEKLGLSPKSYRKLLVGLTNVVESAMCANKWDGINYSHVPSAAGTLYNAAFWRHDKDRYQEWKAELAKPVAVDEKPKAKINVATLYPHEVIKKIGTAYPYEEAWAKLQELFPENDERILPVCDVSGSMTGLPLDVSVALGMFLSQRNRGPFQDCFMTFSERPVLQRLSGSLSQRMNQLQRAQWDMNTNLEAAMNAIAKAAEKADPKDVPTMLLILSDMQFDSCIKNADQNAFKMAKQIFKSKGLELPKIVFWNLRDSGSNTLPVKSHKSGAALVSGFSPSILGGLLNSPKDFTPYGIMQRVLNAPRYEAITA